MAQRILLIEDDREYTRLLQIYLPLQGYEVLSADTGVKGIALARENRPDLILMDDVLPELNMDEITQQLRNDRLTEQIPIIYFAQDPRYSRESIADLDLGIDDYVGKKPFDIEELRLRIKSLLLTAAQRKRSRPIGMYIQPHDDTVAPIRRKR